MNFITSNLVPQNVKRTNTMSHEFSIGVTAGRKLLGI